MNRRSFFRRTVGAAIAGFGALLGVKRLVYCKKRRTIVYGYCHLDGTPTKLPSQTLRQTHEVWRGIGGV